jgi:hypothetical protein
MILPTEPTGGSASTPAKFPLGQLVATPAALGKLTHNDIQAALDRHLSGDWGDLDEEDRAENELALTKGLRLFSVYHGANGVKFYIITEHDRSLTTVLLPSDY